VLNFNINMMKSRIIFSLTLLLLCSGVSSSQDARMKEFGPLFDGKELSHDKLINDGWVYLFDSRITSSTQSIAWSPLSLWRLRKVDAKSSDCWAVVTEEGQKILKNIIPEGKQGTDLITNQEFRDFNIHLEVKALANSGVYLRGRYEIQINSDTPDVKELSAGIMGGIYSVSAPSINAAKGPSEWQTIDASIRGYRITIWLNGKLIQDNIEIPEGKKRIGTGTELGCWTTDGFTNDPEKPGPIMIQGNHGQIDVRNVRILPVPVRK
jgi:hypothetical protein